MSLSLELIYRLNGSSNVWSKFPSMKSSFSRERKVSGLISSSGVVDFSSGGFSASILVFTVLDAILLGVVKYAFGKEFAR